MPQHPHPERDAAPTPEAAPLYGVYGLTLESDFAFTYPLVSAAGPSDLQFICRSEAPDPDFWNQAQCVYATRTRNGERSGLYRQEGREVLRFLDGSADFYLQPERIACHLRDPSYAYGVEIWLLGTVLAYWMERQGLPMLHAAAVVAGGRAVAFLATNRGGKSSLAAALMRAGHPLLTDDLLPVDVQGGTPMGRPGYPQMRLWPDQAAHFTGGYEDLPRVVPHLDKRRVPVGPDGLGTFCNASRPLACFYLPERRAPGNPNPEIEITPVSPRDAVVELVRQSFLPHLIGAAGLQPERMERFFRVARRVPMRRLVYPDGAEHLPRVREALLRDLRES